MSLLFHRQRLATFAAIHVLALSFVVSGCSLFPPAPQPCDCGQAEKELRAYTLKYVDALEDVGNLRHQLKACEERR